MDSSIYTPLSAREDVFEIRLLRLQPSVDPDAMISCSLITYPLHQDERPHLYEALSYVWGDPHITREIIVGGFPVNVTRNLHAALRQLRDRFFERVLWIDALCIDQENPDEVSRQILSMARIYGQASCVLVWLGEEADNSDTALEYIRACGAEEATTFEETEPTKGLLMRPWFSRIWVLQEATSARRIQVLCGSKILDGNAFSAGVQKLQPQLPVNHFIRRAAFLSPIFSRDHIRATSSFNRLGNFLDMYHKYSATKQHDKIYALLGMSTGLNEDIKPDYMLPWHQLFQRTIHHILGSAVRVRTWPQREIATISGLGFVLGTVSSIEIGVPDLYRAKAKFSDLIGSVYTLTIPLHSRLIQKGDVVCLLQGASEATVIRPCKDFFQIIAIQVPLQHMLNASHVDWPTCLNRQHELLLIWDWEVSAEGLQGNLECQNFADRLWESFEEREDSTPSTKSARMLSIAEMLFESNRWRYFQPRGEHLERWSDYKSQDKKVCERVQAILDEHTRPLQLEPTAILNLMWKILVLSVHTYKRHNVLNVISRARNIQAPAQNEEVWKVLGGLDLFSLPPQPFDFEDLEMLILDAEVAESSLLHHLLHRALPIDNHLTSTTSFNPFQGGEREAKFQWFLRFRRKELGNTGAIFVCMLVGSNTRARDNTRLRQLLFGSEMSDSSIIKCVLDLTIIVQTPAALALRYLLKTVRRQMTWYEDWMDDYTILARRAEADSSRTDKSNVVSSGNADQALETLLGILCAAKPTVTEEAMKVAVETISVQGAERFMSTLGIKHISH